MWALRSAAVFAAILLLAGAYADTKSELDAAYAKLNAAVRRKDVPAAMNLFTKDFTWIDARGTSVDRKRFEADLAAQAKLIQRVRNITLKIERLSTKNGVVTARTVGTFEADFKLSPDAKKASRIKNVSTTDDTWVKSGGKWLLKQVRTIKESTTIDGKPLRPGG